MPSRREQNEQRRHERIERERQLAEDEELTTLYAQVWEDGFWIKEFTGKVGMVGVMDQRDLAVMVEASGQTEQEISDNLPLGYLVDLSAGPGNGKSRVEMIKDAWKQAQKARDSGYLPRLAIARERAGLEVGQRKELGTF